MFWQEDEDKTLPIAVPDAVLDVSFAIQCKKLPIDHAWALSQAVIGALPWLADEPLAGIHTIHVAESGNGWERPDDPTQQFLLPSRRTRLSLRLPKHRLTDAQQLVGKTLVIADETVHVGEAKLKTFTPTSTLFARYVLSHTAENEQAFLQRMANAILQVAHCKIKKMLCGKTHTLATTQGTLHTRHLMLADLEQEASIHLQQYGLGEGRKFGCGLFLPHKSIKTLSSNT